VFLPTLKYATQKQYRYMLDVHLNPAFGQRQMHPSSASDASSDYKSELKKQELVVGAPGFEPGTSCAQARRVKFRKSFLCNLFLRTKDLPKNLVVAISARMCVRMRRVPRISPIVSGNHGASATKKAAKSRAVMMRADL
jgi:hypothetical protein